MIASGTTTIDQVVADAQARLAAFINRTAAQQLRRMRESWDDELLAALAAPVSPATPSASAVPHAIAPQATTQVPYPWDDITALDDEIENDLGTAALQLLVSYACIAVVSFALGLFVGQL